MDYFISTDPFWTTIVEYLDYKDIYNLSILSKHFDQTIDVRKILLRKINKGLNLTFGDQENKIKKILMDFNCYISGKFVERLFKSSENYHDSTFVFVTDNTQCHQELEKLFHLKYKAIQSSSSYTLYELTTFFSYDRRLECIQLSHPIEQTHYIRYENPKNNQMYTKPIVLVNYAKLIY